MNTNISKNNSLKPSDFTNFKNMANGPSCFTSEFPKGKLSFRIRTGGCQVWNLNQDNLVGLNLGEHHYEIDAYLFSIFDRAHGTYNFVGWITFDELIEKGEAVIDDQTIYLTLPIKELKPMEELEKPST